ncbi:uncharacterized protein [Nicotiana tomentosiformis]|uniref:uncharacterized protein n=1 Tax=Nicotiana tomentosiformis TaxID=4098 RepID=UPI00388C6E55
MVSMGSLEFITVGERSLVVDVQALVNQFMRLDISEPSRVLACVVSRSSLYDRIRECQYDDTQLLVSKDTVQHGDVKDITIGDDGMLRMQGRICVPNVDGLCELILEEAHSSQYSFHPGAAKMYQDLRWLCMRLYMGNNIDIQWGWFEPGEARLLGTDLVQDTLEKVKLIQERLHTAQSRQKSYADRKVRDAAYMVGGKVLLRVSPMNGVMRFGKKG